MLETSGPSVNSLLRLARAAFETRLPATPRERAPLPNSKLERDVIGRLADAFEAADQISAVMWFADSSVFPHFGLPRMLRSAPDAKLSRGERVRGDIKY